MLLTFDILSLRIFHRYFSSNYLYLLNTNFSGINVSIVLSKSNCSFVTVTLMLLSINNSTGIDRKSAALLESSLKLENVDCVPKFSSYDKILVLLAKTRL